MVFQENTIKVGQYLKKFLRDGEETNMAVDGSVIPAYYSYLVPEGYCLHLHQTSVAMISDNPIDPDEFGERPPLSNGCMFYVAPEFASVTEYLDFLDNETIDMNGSFANFANITNLPRNRGMRANWVHSINGEPLQVNEGTRITWKIQDDLTSLVSFKAVIQGVLMEIH